MTDKRPPRPPDGTSKERPLNQELLDLIRHELPFFYTGNTASAQGWVSYFLEMVQEVESQTQGYFSANMAACMLKSKKELVALLREFQGHFKPAWQETSVIPQPHRHRFFLLSRSVSKNEPAIQLQPIQKVLFPFKPEWLESLSIRVLDDSLKLTGGNDYPEWAQGCDVFGLYLYLRQFEEFSDTEIFAAINKVLNEKCDLQKKLKKKTHRPSAELVRKFIQKRGQVRQKMIDEALEIARREMVEFSPPSSFQDIVK
jgi:hypothetical protein